MLGRVVITGGLGSLGSLVAKWIMLSSGTSDGQQPVQGACAHHLLLAARAAHGSAAARLLHAADRCAAGCVEVKSVDLAYSEGATDILSPPDQEVC